MSIKRRLAGPSGHGEVIGMSAGELTDELVRYHRAGVDLLVLDVMMAPDQLAAIDWIGRNVLPRLLP